MRQSTAVAAWVQDRAWVGQRRFVQMLCGGFLVLMSPGEPAYSQQAFRDCPDCPELVVIPAGFFTMGSPETEPYRSQDEGPQLHVEIVQAFAAGKYEVTVGEWAACVAAGQCKLRTSSNHGTTEPKRPVVNISWDDAQVYIAWLNERIPAAGYRLLTEAEWEYAARAGTITPWHWGADAGKNNFNVRDGGDGTTGGRGEMPVGQFPPNAFGLFDMLGNASEWVTDCYADSLAEHSSQGKPPVGHSTGCATRVIRGGDWDSLPFEARSAARDWVTPTTRLSTIGFRVARSLSH